VIGKTTNYVFWQKNATSQEDQMLKWLSLLWLWKVQLSNQNFLCHNLFWSSQRYFLAIKNNPFIYELNICFDQTSSDANGDCGGTHSINDICMKIWKSHRFKRRCRWNGRVVINIQNQTFKNNITNCMINVFGYEKTFHLKGPNLLGNFLCHMN
jgi:hypothetical protein